MTHQIALSAGKKYFRPETGFVHYFYHGIPGESHATIPTYENIIWALVHFQMKTQEGVFEGKRILEKLLAFQNSEGEFPVYLHEYPKAQDHFLSAYLFHPLYMIQKNFEQVLGKELKESLRNALERMITALKNRYEEKKPQGHICFKTGVALFMSGHGDALLKGAETTAYCSTHLADYELAKELGAPHVPEWPSFLWHKNLQVYAGPAFRELHEGAEPEVTLLDLMMGTHRKSNLSLHHLSLALCQSAPVPVEGTFPGVRQGEFWTWAAINKKDESHIYQQPGLHLFRFLTGTEGKIESLSIPGGKAQKCTYEETPHGIKLSFELSSEFESENRDRAREIELYISETAKIDCSLFRLGETITVTFKKTALKLTFNLKEGEGDFVGQRSQGNRPSQIVKGVTYDNTLTIRTLRRSPKVVIELEVEVEEISDL